VNEKKIVKRYNEEFKRQAVELLIHSGKRQAQVARELGVSDYTLTLWKRAPSQPLLRQSRIHRRALPLRWLE